MPAALCEQACATIIHKVFKERLAYEVVGECVRGETHSRGAPAAVRGTQEEQGTPTPAPLLSRRHVGCSRRAVACVISRFVSDAGAGAAGRGGQVRARAPNARHGFCLQLRRWRRRTKKLRRSQLFTPARLALLERIIHTYDTLYLDEVRDLFAEASGTWTSVSGPGHSGDRLHAQEGAIDRPVVLSACLFAICCFLRWALHAGP